MRVWDFLWKWIQQEVQQRLPSRTSLPQITAYSVCFLVVALIACTSNIRSVSGSCEFSKASPEHLDELAVGINELAINLHKALSTNPTENVFFSPLSISAAFLMLFYGANGETAEELRIVLGYKKSALTNDLIHTTFHHLLCRLQMASNPLQERPMTVANALLVHTDLDMLPAYQDAVAGLYQAHIQSVQFKFAKDAKAATQDVNEWVNEKTHGKIGAFIDDLDRASVMVVLNAVYFKGTWRFPFAAERTKTKLFYNNGVEETPVQVPMMRSKHYYRQGYGDEFQALEMPYKENNLSMLILLPTELDGLLQLEEKLTVELLDDILSDMFEYEVVVTLPKFQFEYERELTEDFKALGAVKIFDGIADFSGMTSSMNAYVSGVLHKAVIEVSEAGTEAAAGTGVAMSGRSAPMSFVADHPFLFAVLDRTGGSHVILFIGRVSHF